MMSNGRRPYLSDSGPRSICPIAKPVIDAVSDELTAAYLALGAKGVISVASNVMPEEVSDLTDAGLDGDFDTALSLQIGLRPLNEFLFCEVNPIPVKALLKEMGLDCGSCRLPLTSLSEAHRGEMKSLLQ